MSNPLSALHGHYVAGTFGRPTPSAGVTLSEVSQMQMIQFSAWTHTLNAIGKHAAATAGVASAPPPGQMYVGKNACILRIEPLRWLLAQDSLAHALIPPEISAEEGVFLDVSSARTWISISGKDAATLLNHFLPIDLRETKFPVGAMACTAFHHLNAILWRENDGYHLLVPRGFALSLWEMLYESALQYGVRITK